MTIRYHLLLKHRMTNRSLSGGAKRLSTSWRVSRRSSPASLSALWPAVSLPVVGHVTEKLFDLHNELGRTQLVVRAPGWQATTYLGQPGTDSRLWIAQQDIKLCDDLTELISGKRPLQ